MKPKIIGTGLSGMVGSRIVELLKARYDFENMSLEEGVDIRDESKVQERISKSRAKIVLHLAAKADVDACEADWSKGKRGEAWQINVLGTENVAQAAEKSGKKIIYISTDFVFDGANPPTGGYTEEDKAQPINWYGQTKYEGEKIISKLKTPFLILRIAFPFRSFFPKKKDFVRAILEKLNQGEIIKAVSDQVVTPTFIDDIALALETLLTGDSGGVYHLVGSQSLTPYQTACQMVHQFGLDQNLISCVKMENYYSKDKAPRPKNLSLKNEKIKKLGIRMRTFKEGLKAMKRQLELS